MSSSTHTILTPLAILFTITHLTSAQQPTPYIPATHTGYSSPSPITSQTPHFLPPLSPSFRLLNSKEDYAASIYLALTSVQSTWTAGPEYPRIISAIHGTFPPPPESPLLLFPHLHISTVPHFHSFIFILLSQHLFPIICCEVILTTPKEAAPTSLYPSLLSSGYNWPAIVTASWYSSIDASIQSQISAQESALQSTFDRMVAQANVEAEKEAAAEAKSTSRGMRRREMLGNGWALGMSMGMGFVVGVWLVGGF